MEQYVLPDMRSYFLPEWEHDAFRSISHLLSCVQERMQESVSYMQEAERLLAGGPLFEQLSFDFVRKPSVVYVVGIQVERARPYDPVRDAHIATLVRKLTGRQDN